MLTKEQQYKIYYYYCGDNISLSKACISPIPKDIRGSADRSPSFGLFVSDDSGDILWKDFSAGEGDLVGGPLKLIQIVERLGSISEAARFANTSILNSPITFNFNPEEAVMKKVEPIVHRGALLSHELTYMFKFGISRSMLLDNMVYSCRGIDFGDGIAQWTVSENGKPKFIYDYSQAQDLSSWKFYNPMDKSKKFKWRSRNTKAVISESFYTLPPKGDVLIIASGKKDSMTLQAAGFISDSPFSENSFKNMVKRLHEYNTRFQNIFILFDGDAPGFAMAKSLSSLTKWKVLNCPYPAGTKDVAEVAEKFGVGMVHEMVKTSIINVMK